MVVRASVGVVVLLVAIDEGGYAIVGRQSLAVVVWWTLLLGFALGLLPRASCGRAFVAVGGSIAALAGLTVASVAWGANPEVAFFEFDRVLLYGGVFLLVATASTPRDAEPVCDGLALGIVAVGCVALGSRLVPGVAAEADIERYLPDASERLAYPVGYWNGLGFLLALAVPLLLRPAVASERPWTRAAAIAGIAPCAAALYLTGSRGAIVAAATAAATFAALSDHRRRAAVAAIAAAGTALAAAAFAELLLRDPAETGGAGLVAGGALAALSLSAGASYAAATSRRRGLPRAPRHFRAFALATAVVLVVGGAVVVDPIARAHAFTAPPERASETVSPTAHLLSANGAGRWQFWSAAVDQFGAHPLAGGGAGSFEPWWTEHGTLPIFVRHAHSLYLETLAELGVLGLALVVAMLAAGLVAASRQRGTTPAAVAACLVAFALAAAIDWVWELPVVSVVAFAALGVAVTFGSVGGASFPRPLRLVAALACVAVAASQALPLAVRLHLDRSEAAAGTGDTGQAVAEARAARSLQPWAVSPRLQLALAYEAANRLELARRELDVAIARNDRDWRLWLVSARLSAKAGDVQRARRSLCRAAELNPRSPLFSGGESRQPPSSCS